MQVRRDWLDPVGLYHTSARRRIATVRQDEVDQTMTGVFGQTEIEWSRYVRTTFGLRADLYQFSVTADRPQNSGRGSKTLASPKAVGGLRSVRGDGVLRQRRTSASTATTRAARRSPSTRRAVSRSIA